MAGDWIKVQIGSGRKPEVATIARLLKVSRRHAYGLLVEFWEWLDSNCVGGVVDGVASTDVDTMLEQNGFAAAMEHSGWVRFDTTKGCMIVKHFDRHNGQTSKNRALKNDRQANWRSKPVDGNVDAQASPKRLPEKRREDIKKDDVDVKGTVGEAVDPQVKDFLHKRSQTTSYPYDHKTEADREQGREIAARLLEQLRSKPPLKPMLPAPAVNDDPTPEQIEAREREKRRQVAAAKQAVPNAPLPPTPPPTPPPKPRAPKPKPNGAAAWNPATDAEVLAEAHKRGVGFPEGSTYADIKALVRAHMKAHP